jgi:hypothetical protein
MNIDELNTKYDEIFSKNAEIQQLLTELDGHNDILYFLYDTDIKRPNPVLNSLIDNYEALIFKIREAHADIKASLAEFGDEKELADGVNANEDLTEKVKELILWKLRRLYMVYDETPILAYVEGDFLNTELIGNAPPISVPSRQDEDERYNSEASPEAGLFPSNPENQN